MNPTPAPFSPSQLTCQDLELSTCGSHVTLHRAFVCLDCSLHGLRGCSLHLSLHSRATRAAFSTWGPWAPPPSLKLTSGIPLHLRKNSKHGQGPDMIPSCLSQNLALAQVAVTKHLLKEWTIFLNTSTYYILEIQSVFYLKKLSWNFHFRAWLI